MDEQVSFIAQAVNETDPDRCRYVLATVGAARLRGMLAAVGAMVAADPGFAGALFSDGVVAHFLDASFPVGPDDDFPEGREPLLSLDESAEFDAEGWARVPGSLVASAPEGLSGFLDEVSDVRLLVSPSGFRVCASWESYDVDAFVRSWSVPWEALG